MVSIVARCKIDYEGRAASALAEGERFLLFKPDGTLLVHTASKLKPVNWQPPGCAFQAEVENGVLVVTATREKPREVVRMELLDVHAIQSFDLADDEALDLFGSEDDLQAFLASKPELVEAGFSFWSRERDSQRGPMDLYGVDAKGRRVVVEVKRRPAAVAEVEQLRRYVEKERAARGDSVRGILLAPRVSTAARKYLVDLKLEWREIDWDRERKAARALLAAGQATLGKWD